MTYQHFIEISEDTVTTVRQLVEQAITKLNRSAAGREVASRILGGETEKALDSLDWDGWNTVLDAMATKLVEVREHGAAEEIAHLEDLGIQLGGPYIPAADRAAAGAAELVTGVSDTTRQAIREWIERAQLDGMSVPDLARQLRDIVGLSPRDALAVQHYREKLEATDGFTKSMIDHRVGQYSDRCIKRRSETIARNELQETSYQARADAWDDAIAAGVIPASAQKTWQVNQGCDICDENDGESVDIGDTFPSGDDMPPAHPNCKCTVFLEGDSLGED